MLSFRKNFCQCAKIIPIGDNFNVQTSTSAWLQGQKTQFSRHKSYVCRPCENQRTRRRHSAFWIGLYGCSWIVSMNQCQELVLEMMASVRNKQPFYQQGLRAMILIQQPL